MNTRIQKLEAFLQDSPNDCFLHHALALEWLKEGNNTQALTHFEHNLNYDKNYIGTYYHLAKLYQSMGAQTKAIETYEQGMQVARSLNDNHSYSELQSAYEDMMY